MHNILSSGFTCVSTWVRSPTSYLYSLSSIELSTRPSTQTRCHISETSPMPELSKKKDTQMMVTQAAPQIIGWATGLPKVMDEGGGPQTTFEFLNLPPEVRNPIYEMALPDPISVGRLPPWHHKMNKSQRNRTEQYTLIKWSYMNLTLANWKTVEKRSMCSIDTGSL